MKENVKVEVHLDGQAVSMVNPTVTVKKSTGSHTKVTVQGIVKEESHELLERSGTMTEVAVQMEEVRGMFFLGVLTYMDIHSRDAEGREYRELYMEAMSATCLLDRTRKRAAFQKKSASYREAIGLILQGYQGAGFLPAPELAAAKLDRFVVQYEETDWEFLSRLASFRQAPLVASHKAKGAKFSLGVIKKEGAYEVKEEEEGEVEVIYTSSPIGEEGQPSEGQRYLRWHVEDPQAPSFEVGDSILFQGRQYYVREAEAEVRDHVFRQQCLLCGQAGFQVREIKNMALTGLSLQGKVKEVKSNRLQVTLDIDAMEETECWFDYSTFYATFYCMPEKGDGVNLYFPDCLEDHAFVLNSIRADPARAAAGFSAGQTAGTKERIGLWLEGEGEIPGRAGEELSPKKGLGEGMELWQGREEAGRTEESLIGKENPEMIPFSPYLAKLAAPEDGKLVNAKVALEEICMDVSLEALGESGTASGGGSHYSGGSPETASYGGGSWGTGSYGGSYGGSLDTGGTKGADPSTAWGKGPGNEKGYDFESMAENENVKVLCTKDGRMVILDDDKGSVSIVCSNDTFIALEKDGISIITDKSIRFEAAEEIRLKAGKELYLTADDNILMACKETMMEMTPEKVSIKGTDIWLNEEG